MSFWSLTIADGFVNSGNGGGILVQAAKSVTLNYCTVRDCEAQEGGAIYSQGDALSLGYSNIGFFDESTAEPFGNVATAGDGGGIWVEGNLTTYNTLVQFNTASGNGGGIWQESGSSTLNVGSVHQNQATNGNGGGLAAQNADLTIWSVDFFDAEFDANKAGANGGSLYLHDSDLVLQYADVVGIAEDGDGGGLCLDGGTFALQACTVTLSEATNGIGGGVALHNGDLSIVNCIISYCSGFSEGGGVGAIGGTLSVSNSTITLNGLIGLVDVTRGGGVYSTVSCNFDTCLVELNSAYMGMGFYLKSVSECEISNTRFLVNELGRFGGGIFSDRTTSLLIESCEFWDNAVSSDEMGDGGGAIFLSAGKTMIVNSTFAENSASYFGGAIHYAGELNSELTIYNSTIANNFVNGSPNQTPPPAGGGIYAEGDFDNGALLLYSTIVADNESTSKGPDVFTADGKVDCQYALLGDSSGADTIDTVGNLFNQDPLLGDLGFYGGITRTYPLMLGSPALDEGDNQLLMLAYDQRGPGYQREVKALSTSTSAKADMGAFEQRWTYVTEMHTYAENKNGKVADNHSRITSIVVKFSQAVTLPTTAEDAFNFRTLPLASSQDVDITVLQSDDNKAVTITFNSFTESTDSYHSLVDGNYQLRIFADQVISFDADLDGDNDFLPGGDYQTASSGTTAIYRLFGDNVNNDRYVSTMDFTSFLAAYGGSGAVFDFDGDGDVDTADYKAFTARYGGGLTTP